MSCSEQSVSVSKTNNQEIPDPFEQNKLLSKTINFGNALEAPNEGEWGIILKELYFKEIKAAGFTAVRLPIRWSAHTQLDSPFTIEADFFSRIDWILDQAEENDLAIIINIHHYEEIFANPDHEKEKFISIWKQITKKYINRPTTVFYEILNEPNDQLTAQLWNIYLAEAIDVIREIDSTHTVIIGPAEWGGISAINKLIIPSEEKNAIFTFHYYTPFEFTHQGAEWVDNSEAWLGTTWNGFQNEKVEISTDFLSVKLWAEQRNLPVFLGEFGAYYKADYTSRFKWTEYVAQRAEQDSFSWAYWEFAAGFGIYDPDAEEWQPLLKALIP
ncbi:MAG: glycoside hydrolase family 5 protein [Calditrichaeota bacterium]|nr:MAG: glycoside hydrolase family 5 protein [Calditrichota bacterium]MBL1205179.1 glycoside hydrolase family 5 protein [Calditrichota bacterium]NOG45009.1 glycoside hydrolase family 5 protein [Calditrichota bacterium]